MCQMLFFIILMTQWSQYLDITIVCSAKWPLWLALGCLAQKYLWSLVFSALKRTSYRSVEECSLGFYVQVSWVAQIRLDFPQICKAIFSAILTTKRKKGKVLRVQYEQGLSQTTDSGHLSMLAVKWASCGLEESLEHCICLPAHVFPLPAPCYRDFRGECGYLSNSLKNIVYYSASEVSWHGENWTDRN